MNNLIEKLKLSQQDAIKFYPSCSQFEKKFLEQTFGSEIFNVKITDKIKTFEDAYNMTSKDDIEIIEYHKLLVAGCKFNTLAHQQLIIIAKVLNEGWTPNWNDANEPKYYPYFGVLSSGLVFVDSVFVYVYACAFVGSRLCFKNRELAIYMGKQFVKIYEKDLIIT